MTGKTFYRDQLAEALRFLRGLPMRAAFHPWGGAYGDFTASSLTSAANQYPTHFRVENDDYANIPLEEIQIFRIQ